ncbi:DUF2911 domain-containing protein [Aquimarina mytili]|uniref:DUF2911 domain-containing protein n=2 Tax=Aquimarina mytili TaxID=874423 RepID=A0A937DC34_9FLAO|nr:DUF2911 domain-containing protein [Aquimarina mytili]MBL0684506.1 DUF2911 domain-containing protein [Aquimarina mytili]
MIALLFSATCFAQLKTPAASTSAKVIQTVGLTDIEIHYSRPSARGRSIFGADSVVLFGNLWRTGANAATKIIFGDDVTISGKELKAGAYAILTKPGASRWDIYFYPYESSNWISYVKKEPAVTISSAKTTVSDKIETFTISIDNIAMETADLVFAWEKTKVMLPIQVEVHTKTMANIEKVLAGPTTFDYYRAALYLHESGKDLNTALQYVQKATKADNPRFFQVYREALILADLGRKTEAIIAAKKSLELSKKAGNDDFVRLNEKLIKEWSK